MQTHLPAHWISRLSSLLAIPPTAAAEKLFTAWAQAEGGEATWNPLNTTYLLPGTTTYNSDGVRNYPSPVVGLAATALTLILPAYAGILGSLQGGQQTAENIVKFHASEFDTWGTGSSLILSVLGQST